MRKAISRALSCDAEKAVRRRLVEPGGFEPDSFGSFSSVFLLPGSAAGRGGCAYVARVSRCKTYYN